MWLQVPDGPFSPVSDPKGVTGLGKTPPLAALLYQLVLKGSG